MTNAPRNRKGYNTYAATCSEGTTVYRQTMRTYTHAIMCGPIDVRTGKADERGWGVWGWAGRADLATKTADQARKCWRNVEIVEAVLVYPAS